MKYRIEVNKWDNWNGYLGNRKVAEFGTRSEEATRWLQDITNNKTKRDVLKLADTNGCTVDVQPNGRVYFDAPTGKLFSSCQSSAIGIGGQAAGCAPINWNLVHSWFSAEIKEGFEQR